MPMAFGIRHGAILIPAVADTWSEDRRRAVLLHELAHVTRHDCLTQMMAAARLRALLGASRRVVGCAPPARRAGAGLRRSRARGGRSRTRIRRAPAGAGVLAGRSARAGARRQHGPPAPARRTHARGPGCRTESGRTGAPQPIGRRGDPGGGAGSGRRGHRRRSSRRLQTRRRPRRMAGSTRRPPSRYALPALRRASSLLRARRARTHCLARGRSVRPERPGGCKYDSQTMTDCMDPPST